MVSLGVLEEGLTKHRSIMGEGLCYDGKQALSINIISTIDIDILFLVTHLYDKQYKRRRPSHVVSTNFNDTST